MMSLQEASNQLSEKLDMDVTVAVLRKTLRIYPFSYSWIKDGRIQISEDTVRQLGEYILRTRKYGNSWEYPPQEQIWAAAAAARKKAPRKPQGYSDEYEIPETTTRWF